MDNLDDVEIRHDPVNQKYDAWYEGDVVGVVVYQNVAGRIVVTHAAIQEEHRGYGVGAKLISAALDDIQTAGKPVGVTCPIVRTYIAQHTRYAHLLTQP